MCLRLLVDQVETLGEEGPATKRVVATALSPALQQCLDIFPVYSTHPGEQEIPHNTKIMSNYAIYVYKIRSLSSNHNSSSSLY